MLGGGLLALLTSGGARDATADNTSNASAEVGTTVAPSTSGASSSSSSDGGDSSSSGSNGNSTGAGANATGSDLPPLALCDVDDPAPAAIGDPVVLCIFLSTVPLKKMVFRIAVEEYAELLLRGSMKAALGEKGAPVYTWASKSHRDSARPLDCQNGSPDIAAREAGVSCPQIYASPTHIAQLTSLVINMRDGIISSFAWDNGCAGCGPEECMESAARYDLRSGNASSQMLAGGTCGIGVSTCASGDAACDLKVFVTWAGTDKNGWHLSSAGMRLSKFTGYTLGSLYRKMSSGYDSLTGSFR